MFLEQSSFRGGGNSYKKRIHRVHIQKISLTSLSILWTNAKRCSENYFLSLRTFQSMCLFFLPSLVVNGQNPQNHSCFSWPLLWVWCSRAYVLNTRLKVTVPVFRLPVHVICTSSSRIKLFTRFYGHTEKGNWKSCRRFSKGFPAGAVLELSFEGKYTLVRQRGTRISGGFTDLQGLPVGYTTGSAREATLIKE